ncbi:MAG: hypothetical protein ABIZ49_01410 [Opitutaceae bacterium]
MKINTDAGSWLLKSLSARLARWSAFFVVVVGSSISYAAQKKAEGVEVLVSADAITTPEGLRPKPGQPVYYVFNQIHKSLGDAVAGIKMPDPAFVERAVVAELAKQGFVRTQVGGPMPSLVILAMWGDSNFEIPPGDDLENYRAFVQTREGATEEEILAEAARLRFMMSGRLGDKPAIESIVGVRKPGATLSPDGVKVLSAANENRLYVTLSALDALLFAKKERRLLWRTSMSIDWRNSLERALPAMLASGGPVFGIDLKEPAFLDERDRRNAEVKIGEAKVVPDDAAATKAPAKK